MILNNSDIESIISNYGYTGVGYYYEILKHLELNSEHICDLGDLKEIARKIKIKQKTLKCFVDACSRITGKQGKLLSKNNKYIWNENLLSKNTPKINSKSDIKINYEKNFNSGYINLTNAQYKKLITKHGKKFIDYSFKIFNSWLESNKYAKPENIKKNHYNFFRKDGWVINETKNYLQNYNISS